MKDLLQRGIRPGPLVAHHFLINQRKYLITAILTLATLCAVVQFLPSLLAVHANHLNRSVKEVTGKSTTTHITERIITEAKALLQHTDWTIAEIAYALGFEYPTYFNNYFKRMTGTVPSNLRMQLV